MAILVLVLGLQVLGLGDQGGQPGDLLAEHGGVDRDDLFLQPFEQLALLVLGQFVEVVGYAAFDPLAAVSFGIGQDLLAPLLHPFQRPPHGVDAGGHPALKHRHDEADGPAGRRVVGRSPDRLVLDEACQGVVEVELLLVQLEGGGLDLALGEELLDLPGLRVGETDQGLLGPPEVERRTPAPHGIFEASDVAVNVLVQQRQEPAEVLGVALVRRGRHQQVVVGHVRERLAESIGQRLPVVGVGTHLVGLVHDDEVPVRAEQALLGVFDARDPGDRRDDLVAVLPGVLAVGVAQGLPADDLEALAELVLQLPLPLEREVRRSDDQRAPDQAPGLQLLEQQPRHDRLAGARVVGQEEADSGQLEEVVVDRLELVGEGIDAGDREREERVVFVGQPEPMGLDAQAEQGRVAIEALVYRGAAELSELSGCEDRIADQAGLAPLADQLDGVAEWDDCQNLDRLGQQRPSDHRADVDLIDCHGRLTLGRLRPRKQRRLRNETLPTDDIKQS